MKGRSKDMEKQIKFLGVNLTPYSDMSPDGGLAVCSGLERHAGSLRPVVLHGTSYALPEDKTDVRLLAVHDTASFSHFIFQDSSRQLYWSSRTTSQVLENFGEPLSGEVSVKALGNTLVAIDGDGMHYYVWEDGQYTYLGQQMPHLPLVFGLRGSVVEQSTEIEIKGDYSSVQNPSGPIGALYVLTEEDRAAVNAVLPGFVNQLLADYKERNEFVYPFFVRWGYETVFGDMLYSPPVLMMPNSGGTVNVQSTLDAKANCDFFVTFFATVLDYSLAGVEEWKEELGRWADIITGINFYVSDPLAAYVSDGQYSQVWNSNSIATSGQRRNAGFGIVGDGGGRYWTQSAVKAYYSIHVQTPVVTDEEYNEKFRTTSVFWKVATIKPEGLEENAVVQMEANTLVNLGTQEHIDEEPLGEHDQLIPRYSFIYNQRLHIANVTRRLFGFQAETLFTHEAGHSSRTEYRYAFYVYCNDNGGNQVVKCDNGETSTASNFYWLYYPNPSGYKVVIEQTAVSSGDKKYAEVPMKEHPLLNGSYYFDDFNAVEFSSRDAGFSIEEQPLVDNPNKLYTSEVGTPYHFPSSGINTVGVGDILGLASVTTALSQGQFGQFPLMVFCSDGNYALQVSSEGLFSNVSPMQRDVCTNPDSITPTDGAIIFISAKGVMTADGSDIRCISEVLDGVPDEMATACITPPRDYFQDCLVAYDYAGRRLIFLSKEEETAWLMSLEDASWSQAGLGTVAAIVNVYPYSYIQFVERHEVLRLDKAYLYEDETVYTGKLLTRPLKLDSLQLKSIHQFVLEGNYSHVQKMTLYASNNGRQWLKLGESTSRRVLTPGRYFKYYRIGIDTSLTEAEDLSGVRVDYALRPERRYR